MVEQLNRRKARHIALAPVALALVLTPALAARAQAATPVVLGTADSFALLAGSTITNTGATTIMGDIGLCCTGLGTPGITSVTQPGGARYVGTGTPAQVAQADLDTAYDDAAGRPATIVPVDLSASGTPAIPLLPGVYRSPSRGVLEINTGLTLDFEGDPNAVFIFQGTTLTTAASVAGSVHIVDGGASPSACNIFWQLSSDATGVRLGTASAFKGTTMALGASVLGTGATIQGRILTRRSKAVNLDSNTITRSACSTAVPEGGGDSGTPAGTPTPGTPTAGAPAAGGSSTPARPPAGGNGRPPAAAAATPSAARPSSASGAAGTPRPARGTAQLSGPTGTVSNPFSVAVRGRAIQSVTFSLDGRRLATVHAKRGRKVFRLTINPRGQSHRVHRVTARVRFSRSSRTPATTRRLTYRRSAALRAPRFTG